MIQQWSVQKAISENILGYERSYKEKNQTDLYPAEFTGELLRILSAIRVQQRRKRSKFRRLKKDNSPSFFTLEKLV